MNSVSAIGRPAPAPDAGDVSGRVLVLGLGNDILCDDAVGLHVCRALGQRFAHRPEIDAQETCEMGLSLLDFMIGYSGLVLIDSIQTGHAPPGHIHELSVEDLAFVPAMSPHFLGVGEVMAAGRALGFTVPSQVRILAVEVSDPFRVTTEMTPVMQQALPRIVDRAAEVALSLSSFERN